jgi:hypothetical protein
VRARALALAVVAATTLGGCLVRADRPSSPVAEEFQRSQRVVLDLTEPPTREEAGLVDGKDTLIVERDGDRPLDVAFTLPGGERLAVPAIGVVFATGVTGGTGGPVESITVNRVVDDVAAARAAVLADAARLNIPEDKVTAAFGRLQAGEPVQLAFEGSLVGYLRPAVEVRHQPGQGTGVEVHYSLDWGSMLR